MNIKITEIKEEMIAEAKRIISENTQKYNPRTIGNIKKVIEERMPSASVEEKEALFYISIYDYWVYGTKIEEEFYLDLRHKSRAEKKEYINYMEHIVYAYMLNKKENRDLLYNKYETYKYLTPFYKRDVILLNGASEEFATFKQFVLNHPEFIVKPIDSHMGEGVHKETLSEMSEESVFELYNKLVMVGENNIELYKTRFKGCVCEEIFDQDVRMNVFNDKGVNDVRCTTIRKGKDVIVYYPWLSCQRAGRFLTPYSDGRIICGINAKTGVVDSIGRTEGGESFDEHPQVGIKYMGFQVPEWDALIQTVTEAALKLPDINYVGWDMVLTKKGWAIQEANFAGEPMWQMIYQKGNKAEFERIAGVHLTKDFWWQEKVDR